MIFLVWKFADWFMLVRANLELVHFMLELSITSLVLVMAGQRVFTISLSGNVILVLGGWFILVKD